MLWLFISFIDGFNIEAVYMLLESIRLVIYCRICVEFSVGISDVEFSDTLLMNLLHKIRHCKLCVGIVVSNVDRIRVPTVDDQPYKS